MIVVALSHAYMGIVGVVVCLRELTADVRELTALADRVRDLGDDAVAAAFQVLLPLNLSGCADVGHTAVMQANSAAVSDRLICAFAFRLEITGRTSGGRTPIRCRR